MPQHSSTSDWQAKAKLVGESQVLADILYKIGRVAACDAPVLVLGETGTGKELVARATHYLSPRQGSPFVPVNCGAIPDTLIESELFGHVRGAFTGASHARAGLVRAAEGGTLFLDEVETLTPRAQVVLLRFLQDKAYRPVGDDCLMQSNLRIIAAANVDLDDLSARGEFRRDLYFRLSVLSVEVPALRHRVEDIEPLAKYFLKMAAVAAGGEPKRLTPGALCLLRTYSWPGNVRELEHLMLRVQVFAASIQVESNDLLYCAPRLSNNAGSTEQRLSLRDAKRRALREAERLFVESALTRSGGNISEAARVCSMDRSALSRLAKKYRQSDAKVTR